MNDSLTLRLKQHAFANGIDLIGITSAKPFIIERKKEPFIDPKDFLSDAKAIIVTGFHINESSRKNSVKSNTPTGRYNAYDVKAFMPMEEHHIRVIGNFLESEGYIVKTNKNYKIPDKMAAVRAGLGKYGKNSLVITKQFGSFIMFVTLVTNAPLEYKEFSANEIDCGKCEICIKSCPTGAIYAPMKVNRDLCITGWLWGDFIPIHLREKQENRLFGCGECVKVCPKNRKLKPREHYPVKLEDVNDYPELIPLLSADDDYFEKAIASFPLCAGKESILGNAIIALGNIGLDKPISALTETIMHNNPKIRAYTAWTLGQIKGSDSKTILQTALKIEKEVNVISEIKYALTKISS